MESKSVNGQLKVHYIDVGQANCILIQQGGKNMMIDAGNNADASTIIGYLKKNEVSKLNVVVATHPQEDHIGAMDEVIKTFDIGTIYASSGTFNTQTFVNFINAVKNKGLKQTTVPGIDFTLGDVKCTILAPNSDKYEDLNNFSVVVKLTYEMNSFLFEGDAEDISEKEILSKGFDVTADVLKLGHHGSSSSSTQAYLNKVNPKYAVVSVGKGNAYGHPHKETINELKTKGVQVFRTDESGTVVATSDGSNISFNVNPGSYSYGSCSSDSGVNSSNNCGGGSTAVTPAPAQKPSSNDRLHTLLLQVSLITTTRTAGLLQEARLSLRTI